MEGPEAPVINIEGQRVALGPLRVFSYNQRAIKVYQKVGFKHAGRWRGAHRVAGEPHDVIFMDCLATEFKSPVMRRLLIEELL